MKKSFSALFCVVSLFAFARNGFSQVQKSKIKKDKIEIFILDDASLYVDNKYNNKGDQLVINGPLYGKDNQPVGGYISNGMQKKDFIDHNRETGNFRDYNAIFGQKKDGKFFLITNDFNNRLDGTKVVNDQNTTFAIQNGMTLLMDGVNIHNPASKNRTTRQGIGYIEKTNQLVVIDCSRPITFYELGQLFEELGVENAIYLDGAVNGYVEDGFKHGNLPADAMKIHIK